MTNPTAYETMLAWRALLEQGEIASKAGNRQLAEKNYEDALQVALSLSDQELATSVIHLADFLAADRQFERAERLYRQAAELYDRSFGAGNFIGAMCWKSLSAVLAAMGKHDEAEQALAKASSTLGLR